MAVVLPYSNIFMGPYSSRVIEKKRMAAGIAGVLLEFSSRHKIRIVLPNEWANPFFSCACATLVTPG